MAKRSAQGSLRPPITVVSVRRKKSTKSFQRGSVTLSGQRLTIRIIVTERLNAHKLWKYKYEVVSRRSPFHDNIDVAYSSVGLRDGHTYFVLMNDDTKNPRILKSFHEVME